MLDIKVVRDNPDLVKKSIEKRRLDLKEIDVDQLLEVDAKWRSNLGQLDELRAQRNELSAKIKKLDADERKAAIDRVKSIKQEMSTLEDTVGELKRDRDERLGKVPNLIAEDVPLGTSDDDNLEVSRWGEPAAFDFEPRDHVVLGELTDTIDFDRAAKVSGSNFYYLKREAALLENALCAFAAAELAPRGFVPFSTPDLARGEILSGIGFAPRGPERQVYNIEESDLSLIGTAEITLGGYHSDEILSGESLPLRYLGFSHCFRTEAGAYGKESRGLYRVHQFTKAEMFIFCDPDDSHKHHEELREIEEHLLQKLEIPYRVVNVCSGELGAPALKKYDLEAWMPGRNAYGEVTSCSNCTDYQARRLNIRFRADAKASPRVVHMLNGTALAISRTLIAIFENGQRADGSIVIPAALRPFLGGLSEIPCRG